MPVIFTRSTTRPNRVASADLSLDSIAALIAAELAGRQQEPPPGAFSAKELAKKLNRSTSSARNIIRALVKTGALKSVGKFRRHHPGLNRFQMVPYFIRTR